MPDKNVPISHLPRLLLATHTGAVPNARAVYTHVLNGKFPADCVNGRWIVNADDLPAIAKALGLTPKPATSRSRTAA
jgi:hypothetical protein